MAIYWLWYVAFDFVIGITNRVQTAQDQVR